MKNIIGKTITYIIYGLGIIQILFGIMWLISSVTHLSAWQETLEYIDISKTWVFDEYVGILYPLIIKLFTLIEGFLGVPFFMPIYLLQLLAAAGSAWYVCKTMFSLRKSQLIWASAYILTFPILLQAHLSISPQSLVFSTQMVLIGILLSSLRKKQFFLFAGGLTIISGLLFPDALWISGCIWIFSLRKMAKKEYLLYFGTVLLAMVITLGTLGFIQTPGSRGRIQKTFWAGAFQRVVTEYFSRSYAMWDERVRNTFTIEEAMECAKRSDNMIYLVGPALEEEWGRKAANESYKDMTMSCLRVRTRSIVYQIRDDLIDSSLMPFSILWQTSPGRTSQTGWNYDNFKETAKGIAPFYFYFSIVGLAIISFWGIVRHIFLIKTRSKATIILCGVVIFQALLVTLKTGDGTDYRKLLMVIGVYCLFAVSSAKELDVTNTNR